MVSEYSTSGGDESSDVARGETPRVITDVGFVKLGGAAELVAVGLVVVSLALSITSGLPNRLY